MEKQVSITTMKAYRYHDYGGPEKLILEDIKIPDPKANEVLVHIKAVAINPVDWKFMSGTYKSADKLNEPVIPGYEAAGIIEELGQGVTKFKKGQAVYGNIFNSFADYAIVDAQHIYPKPEYLSFEEASTIPVASQTAWASLFDTAELQKDQRVLIQGAAGSVGVFAIQLAKWKGAFVIGTTSGANTDFVINLGADEVINYETTKFENVVKDVDVVLESIGGDTQERSFQVLRKGGILVSIVGNPSQENATKYGVRATSRSSGISSEGLTTIQKLVDNKTLKTFIREILPIDKAKEAFEKVSKLHGKGKIVLKVS